MHYIQIPIWSEFTNLQLTIELNLHRIRNVSFLFMATTSLLVNWQGDKRQCIDNNNQTTVLGGDMSGRDEAGEDKDVGDEI
jgi:hypothetical protein